ncbi:MAG: response regulator [Leptothrix sp. (in: b-proteobacteria)]
MKALLIDDHPLILWAMQSVILRLGDHVSVIGVETAEEARQMLQQHDDFDIVLLDLQLGDANGFDVLQELRSAYPALPVVIVSASDRASDVIRAIDGGAMGFVPKRASNEMLFEALHLVMSGGIYVPPMALALGSRASASAALSPASRTAEFDPIGMELDDAETVRSIASQSDYQMAPTSYESLGLTSRQREVLALLLQGKPNKMIARELGLSVETIKDHVAAVLRSLGVSSRTQAVLAISQMQQRQAGVTPLRG